MKYSVSEEYYELANEWQRQIVDLLKDTLMKEGVAKDSAEDIVGEFLFNLSMLHDQGEIRINSKEYNPKICFDDYEGTIIGTDEDTYLHEYAFGLTKDAFNKE